MTLQQLKQIITISGCNSMNEASKKLFISQPSLSIMVKELEKEIGIEIFVRSNKGIVITSKGKEFLGYAKQVTEQYKLLEDRYINKIEKQRFSVSLQHYSFGVEAFMEIINEFEMKDYEFSIHETKTYEVIEDVKEFRSEIGILYLSDFNCQIIQKILRENNLEFIELFECDVHAYLHDNHPLSIKKEVSLKELNEYPFIAFDQGKNNSFYFSEEMKSTYEYKRIIKVEDRATMQNLIIGLNGYTLCSGITSKSMNEECYIRVPLKESEKIKLGYIKKKGFKIGDICNEYIEKLKKYN